MPDSEISQFTTVFRATGAHRVKRNRQSVSCTTCQRRKSKCDRQHPCGACERRGGGNNCRYESSSERSSGKSRQQAQLKLCRLEEMVRGLAETGENQQTGSHAESGTPAPANGHALGNVSQSVYHGATAWTTLVESIRDIQALLATDAEPDMPNDIEALEPEIVLGVPPLTVENMMRSLPPRQETDQLIMAYFNAKFVSIPFIHTHHFKRRYDAFWEDPSSTEFLWISILFSILSIGVMITHTKTSTPLSPPMKAESRFYMAKSAQCLVAGQYMKAKPFSVEALLMHAHSRNVQKQDFDSSLWALYGLTVRLAQRQGYHLDHTKMSRTISPFEAEMRRRTWFLIQSTDLLYSFHNGMPSVISEDTCDVDHPTNLTDDDFDEDTITLPAPRPPTDPIPSLVCIEKSKLCRIMRRVTHQDLSVSPTTYSKTLTRNQELENWHNALPPCLRIRPIGQTAFTDQNYTIMHRVMLETMYLKTLCILHRQYLTSQKDDARYDASRRICTDSALRILEIQADLDGELKPGGRIYEDRFMISNLTLHHFLLAAMVVCLDLSESTGLSAEDRTKRVRLLRTACSIWSSRKIHSSDAMHATKILRAILKRVDTPGSATDSSVSVPATPDLGTHPRETTEPNVWGAEGSSSTVGSLPTTCILDDPLFESVEAVDLDTMPGFNEFWNNNTDMLDWFSIDQYIQPQVSHDTSWKEFFSDLF